MAELKSALVTGASRGIGAEVARRLAREGYKVYINYAASEEKAQHVADDIDSNGGRAVLCKFDISNPIEVEAAFSKIQKDEGPLNVLVNNAGMNKDGLLMRLRDEDISKIIDTNLKGTIYCTREAIKGMIRARTGSVVLISSVVGQTGNAGQSAYSAAKAGMIGFAKSVAQELAGRSVRVNVIAPGFIQTDMTEALTEGQKGAIVQKIPLGFIGTPSDIADAVSYLASDQSRYITGHVLSVNGGMFM